MYIEKHSGDKKKKTKLGVHSISVFIHLLNWYIYIISRIEGGLTLHVLDKRTVQFKSPYCIYNYAIIVHKHFYTFPQMCFKDLSQWRPNTQHFSSLTLKLYANKAQQLPLPFSRTSDWQYTKTSPHPVKPLQENSITDPRSAA